MDLCFYKKLNIRIFKKMTIVMQQKISEKINYYLDDKIKAISRDKFFHHLEISYDIKY